MSAIKIGLTASALELACILFVHGSHRAAVAVVSGQAAPFGESPIVGWLVVLAEMTSVLVFPPLMLAALLALLSRPLEKAVRKRMHTASNRK